MNEMEKALRFCRDIASEEYTYQQNNVGAEIALRHIIRKCDEVIANQDINPEIPVRLEIGQLWWDKHHKWCDGSKTTDACFLILSGDIDHEEQGNDIVYWKCAFFMWVGKGYCGATLQKFTEEEIRLMEYVGTINDIKSFDGDSKLEENNSRLSLKGEIYCQKQYGQP